MFAGPSIPVPCPFQDAYFVSYNNNSGGLCDAPKSYVAPCASESKFNFQFKRCSNALDSYDKGMYILISILILTIKDIVQ